ncbi:hypothetical protein IAU60_005113 [Kwoniella sp. DSM 27419]
MFSPSAEQSDTWTPILTTIPQNQQNSPDDHGDASYPPGVYNVSHQDQLNDTDCAYLDYVSNLTASWQPFEQSHSEQGSKEPLVVPLDDGGSLYYDQPAACNAQLLQDPWSFHLSQSTSPTFVSPDSISPASLLSSASSQLNYSDPCTADYAASWSHLTSSGYQPTYLYGLESQPGACTTGNSLNSMTSVFSTNAFAFPPKPSSRPSSSKRPRLAIQTQGLETTYQQRRIGPASPYTYYGPASLPKSYATEANDSESQLRSVNTRICYDSSSSVSSPADLGTPLCSLEGCHLPPASQRESPIMILSSTASSTEYTDEAFRKARLELASRAQKIRALRTTVEQEKARATWVRQWLLASYVRVPGSTVPRQGLYHSYTLSSSEFGIKPVNPATFGKAVRHAFPGKYHYISLKPALTIEADRLNAFGDSSGRWHVAGASSGLYGDGDSLELSVKVEAEDALQRIASSCNAPVPSESTPRRPSATSDCQLSRCQTSSVACPIIDDKWTASTPVDDPIYELPDFPTLLGHEQWAGQLRIAELYTFWQAFCEHQEMLVQHAKRMDFDQFEASSRSFWSSLTWSQRRVCDHAVVSKLLTKSIAVALNHIIGSLQAENHPAMVHIPWRGFARRLEANIPTCLASLPISETLADVFTRTAHLITRVLDWQQITAALEPLLDSAANRQDIGRAWAMVDIPAISRTAAMSLGCPPDITERLVGDFSHWIDGLSRQDVSQGQKGHPHTKALAKWVEGIIDGINGIVPGLKLHAIECRVASITSLVTRDLTIRSDKAFGTFQLIKTFIDDYVYIYCGRRATLALAS